MSTLVAPEILRQQRFQEQLHQTTKLAEERLASVKHAFDEKAMQDPEIAELLQQEGGWYERLHKVEALLNELKDKAEVRQSLVVTGKRGQGKTTLIRQWLAKGVRAEEGCDPLPLPTGVEETTCAMVRLTSSSTRDPMVLEVRLLPEDALLHVQQRPPRPAVPQTNLLLARSSKEPDLSPFAVMRYPVERMDANVYLEKDGDRYVVSRHGQMPLPEVQYHVAEVIVPFSLHDLTSHTKQLLEVMDVVDAPGADPGGTGRYPDWVRNKSRAIFRLCSPRIDLLLLVCSSEVAAIHLGGQMEEEILRPWRERCGGRVHGRLLIVITHAADLLQDVSGMRTRSSLEEKSPSRRIVGNVLEPLSNLGFLDLDDDPDDWPPIFFVENEPQQLAPFRAGWQRDPARVQRLFDLLDQPEDWKELSLGEQAILRIAGDWETEYSNRWSQEKIRRIQRWFIRALCHLLDPDDGGLGLLTQFLLDWGQRGPVARNYLSERIAIYQEFHSQYLNLLAQLNEPDFHSALRDLQVGKDWLKRCWPEPGGLDWRIGPRGRNRREQAKRNSGPDRAQHVPFTFEDVLRDLVEDAIEQLESSGARPSGSSGKTSGKMSIPAALPQSAKEQARTALLECLSQDYCMQQLERKYHQAIVKDPEHLIRVQAFGLERLTRIIDYLVQAGEMQLRQVLRYCYRKDLTQNALVRDIYQNLIAPHEAEDREVFGKMLQTALELQREMESWTWGPAY